VWCTPIEIISFDSLCTFDSLKRYDAELKWQKFNLKNRIFVSDKIFIEMLIDCLTRWLTVKTFIKKQERPAVAGVVSCIASLPIDSLHMVSYYRPIVTLCLKCTVFETWRHIGRKSPKNLPQPHLARSFGVTSCEFFDDSYLARNSWARMRGAQLTAGYTVNTYSKPPLYYTLGAVAPLLPCIRTAAMIRTAHTLGPGGPLPHADRQTDARQTGLTNQPDSSRFASTQL